MVFGATGVTGREVARYVGRRAPELGLRWAAAGRSRARLEESLTGVGVTPDELLLVDVDDEPSVRRMAEAAAVVVNLVGPYASYGERVYAACAETGTAQLDLTGEVDWVRTMITRFGAVAARTGARIVPSAGFEALPFDLGARLAASAAHERSGSPVRSVDVALALTSEAPLRAVSDAVSGGTFRSGVDGFERGTGTAGSDPYALDPADSTASGGYSFLPRRHAATGDWLAPVLPSPVLNPPIVHRGAALSRSAGEAIFAPDFRYTEGSVAASLVPIPGASVLAPGVAASLSVAQTGLTLGNFVPGPVRRVMADAARRLGPQPGDGPAPDTLDAWRYRLDVRAECVDGTTADVAVTAVGHPGYKSTATMVGEAGLVLADPSAPVPDVVGFQTPATALGLDVLGRFEAAGLRFRVVG